MILQRSLWRNNISVLTKQFDHAYSTGPPGALERRVQSYISKSQDPFFNLSFEHFLLQRTDSQSSVLFQYINRPCIVIGRNQNPWYEVNLSLLDTTREPAEADSKDNNNDANPLSKIDLVRRRSGGGTVFHDEGNVNWTVISPSASFTRDKHAEMVVKALRGQGVARSRVNERHDIVLDQGRSTSTQKWGSEQDLHATPWQTGPGGRKAFKVSGSAYKLTRGRALHHGTCLLSSPNLHVIPEYLHSPAKLFMKARGVESVSSPVGNIGITSEHFIGSVQEEFGRLYHSTDGEAIVVDEKWLQIEDVKKGYEELKVGTSLSPPGESFSTSLTPSRSLWSGPIFRRLNSPYRTYRQTSRRSGSQSTNCLLYTSPSPRD